MLSLRQHFGIKTLIKNAENVHLPELPDIDDIEFVSDTDPHEAGERLTILELETMLFAAKHDVLQLVDALQRAKEREGKCTHAIAHHMQARGYLEDVKLRELEVA